MIILFAQTNATDRRYGRRSHRCTSF